MLSIGNEASLGTEALSQHMQMLLLQTEVFSQHFCRRVYYW